MPMLSFFYFLDPLYFLFIGPFLLLGLWAQSRVKGSFRRWSEVPLRAGLSGADAAQMILRGAGIDDVRVEPVAGLLSDHYDPRARVVRLSDDVLRARSVAAVAVAAHECGHAIQDAQGYRLMRWRSSLVPAVHFANKLALPMFLIGIFLFLPGLAWIGVGLFGVTTLFHLVTLPVEFDASARAIRIVEASGMAAGEELRGVRQVLYAAGFTYLAALMVSAAELVYWLMRSGLLGGRD